MSQKTNIKQNLQKICGCDVEISEPRNKRDNNYNLLDKVIVFGVSEDFADDNIRKQTGNTQVKRLLKGTNKEKTTTVVLSFTGEAPKAVKIGFESFRTKLYIPPPIRCWKCNSFGHIEKSCKGKICCPRCAQAHSFKDCPQRNETALSEINAKCKNCKGDHAAAFKRCPFYLKVKEIIEIKTKNQMTYAEAAKVFASSQQVATTLRSSNDNPEGSGRFQTSDLNVNSNGIKSQTFVDQGTQCEFVDQGTQCEPAPEEMPQLTPDGVTTASESPENSHHDTIVMLMDNMMKIVKMISKDVNHEIIEQIMSLMKTLIVKTSQTPVPPHQPSN